jgi:hypothetical protein
LDYLALVNKVIQESASETDELTVGTWSSAEAGRRLYPRIKRLVAEAWKIMQIERNEWEFKAAELSALVYPRVKFNSGDRAVAPPVGTVFISADNLFSLTVKEVILESGTWLSGTAQGQIEFEVWSGGVRPIPGEVFEEETPGTGTFVYLEVGSYDFKLSQTDINEIQWTTFTANQGDSTAYPVQYMPFENWFYQNMSFTTSTLSPPNIVSQDAEGKVVFYPQTLSPFRVNFIYTKTPQYLTDPADEPENLPLTYHEWIAWRALENLALFDKNTDLYSYAVKMGSSYKNRAERNLMPLVSWAGSAYDE